MILDRGGINLAMETFFSGRRQSPSLSIIVKFFLSHSKLRNELSALITEQRF